MFRLLWHVLPEKKSTWIALTHLYGIWVSRSKKVLLWINIDFEKKVKDLAETDQKAITDAIKVYVLENDLKREISSSIKRLKEIKTRRWMRHNLWMPVRWQKTRKNARTAKKLLWRSRVRPVLKK